ncbi:MAG: methylenetetrahydrofolate reductase [NAD(P)H] [Chitinispirillia bacterium]|nr:methylenetetrahydrofolate reductase [NAD(P)H] [Chitinispirillia bacterium]MCL2241139.1 methylenetetrahydrofolate reductase [NAD(P)H] [Chitinispirillia bacterium]
MASIADILKSQRISFSFEFFPPKDHAASDTLFHSISELIPLKPAYVSVTYGAGGSTVDLTHGIVTRLQRETGLTVVSHLTCVGTPLGSIKGILDSYYESGIRNIMALRGDMPKGGGALSTDFKYAADLVAYIKKNYPDMGIGVAGFPEGHPETPNRLKEIDYLKAKVDAGADYICTQLFFDNRDFYDFRERCVLAGIEIPIIAGIMPVTNRKGMARMAELALGARFPAKMIKAFSRATDEGFENMGIHWATEQVMDLINNDVKGVHFFTLNKSKATISIYHSLGAADSLELSRDTKP